MNVMKKTKSKLVFKPLPADDPGQKQPDISFAAKKLQWKPTTKLETGLKKTIEYFNPILDQCPPRLLFENTD